jgi:hypothetical protein
VIDCVICLWILYSYAREKEKGGPSESYLREVELAKET